MKSNRNGILPYVLRFFFFLNWTRTNDKLLQICIMANLGETVRSKTAGASPRPTINTFFICSQHCSHCIIAPKSAYTSIGDCMRNKIGLQWCGFAFVSIVGTLWHFIYQWTGDNRLVALVCPVNESPWEHLKLLWFPFLLWCLINLRSTKDQQGAWARHCAGALTGIGVITALFFTYKGIIGRDVMALDIISFILGVGNAFWIDAVLARNGKLQGKSAQTAGVFLLLAVSALFMLFTFYPPKIAWFLDEQSGIYGI